MVAKELIGQEEMEFLKNYLNNPSPTGYEIGGQKIWMKYLEPYVDEFITGAYGTAVGVINSGANFKVVIEAHADEISWSVNYITKNGLIYVTANGGSDHQIATSKVVNIHTKNGVIEGVFGWPAIQTRNKKKEKAPNPDNIFVDIGCTSRKEAKNMGVEVGCMITYPDKFRILNGNKYVCRGLDNRIGGFMIAQVARLLKENGKKLPFGLYITNSVQEEVGLNGAQMIAQRINPDIAIVTDVTHDTTTPMIEKAKKGYARIGKGPVILYAPAVQNKLRDFIIDTAIENQIPFQKSVHKKKTGTDTDAFAYSTGGVISALISMPLRYMHTTVEMVHKSDVEHVINLIYQCLLKIKEGEQFSYFE